VLAIVCTLIWCTVYNRWTLTSWQTPITYHSGDIDLPFILAEMKMAEDGHLSLFHYSIVPELGAPLYANWNDYPITEKLLFGVTGWLARIVGLFAAANLAVLAAQVLAAVFFYVACRLLHASWVWAFAGGIVFGMSRFAFAHELHHITVIYYWCAPLCFVVVEWIASGEGIQFRDRKFLFALLVAIFTGLQNVYYTSLFAQFVILAGLLQGWRYGWRRGWSKALPAAAILATTLATGLLMTLNTIIYQWVYGYNKFAIDRSYMWLEVYGLKFVDLVIPPPDHRLPFFAHWGLSHLGEAFLSWGEMPPTGYIGLLGLAALTWLAIVSFRRIMNNSAPPVELWLVLWIFLYGAVGGINGIIGSFGIYLFRATTRYSIFILCIVLMFAVRRLSRVNFQHDYLAYAAALLLVGISLWDTVPPLVTRESIVATARDVAWDRDFTEKIEQRLPPNAMVFQIPVVDFPEGGAIPGGGPYDHFRPYFFSHHLHFSFGTDKGRPPDLWPHALMTLPTDKIIDQLESYGFAALYINRNGLPDQGAEFIKVLKQRGCDEKIENGRGDVFCVLLKPSPKPVLVYDPSALWPSTYSRAVQTEIALHAWTNKQADAYVAMQAAHPEMVTDGLILWFKADAGVTQDANGNVSQWTDQAGNFNVSQSGLAMPVFVAHAVHNEPALHFNGSQWLGSTDMIGTNAGLTMIVVGDTPAPATNQIGLWLGGNVYHACRGLGYFSGQQAFSGFGNDATGGAAPDANVFATQIVTLNPALNDLNFYLKGTANGHSRMKGLQDVQSGITVGRIPAWDGYNWLGDIAEVLVYDHQLSSTELHQINSYLANKYVLMQK